MKLCFFGFHDWKIYSVFNYIDTSYDDNSSSHALSLICLNCKKTKKISHWGAGHLTDEQIEKIKEL